MTRCELTEASKGGECSLRGSRVSTTSSAQAHEGEARTIAIAIPEPLRSAMLKLEVVGSMGRLWRTGGGCGGERRMLSMGARKGAKEVGLKICVGGQVTSRFSSS